MVGAGRLTPHELTDRVEPRLPTSPIAVAVSGGADSAVLAWVVASLGRNARAVSIDHGLAGSASLMDAAAAVASSLGLEHVVIPVAARSESETDLREARLAALEAALRPGEVIATAHTMDDQAETVLGNVLRGTGTTGLAGIPSRRDRWIRPMLDVTRADVRAIAAALALPFVDDPQNDDVTIRRNRLRSETIPRLADDYNPALLVALAHLGDAAAADDTLLASRAAAVPIRSMPDTVLVPAASLQTLPDAISARVAARALRLAGAPIEHDSIRAIVAAARGHRRTIPGGVDVIREGPWVSLVTGDPPVPGSMALPLNGVAAWGDWVFEVSDRPPIGRGTASIPFTSAPVVRAPAPGERIDLGGGSKSVSDVLSEAAIPVRLRARWPVVESDGTIVWIAGVRAAPAGDSPRATVRATRRRV